MDFLELDVIHDFGFTETEFEAISNHFLFQLSYEDWESIEFIEGEEEDGNYFFKLPTGRMVYFPEELLHKEILAQID